jgi:hypothetical protein
MTAITFSLTYCLHPIGVSGCPREARTDVTQTIGEAERSLVAQVGRP